MEWFQESTSDGIAFFRDHVFVYLSLTEKQKILNGETVTIDLVAHPGFDKIQIVQDELLPSKNRWQLQLFPESRTIQLSVKNLSESKEINIEIGGSCRNYVLRTDGWSNDFSDWEYSVSSARKMMNRTILSTL